jgi:hypothetical protein
VSTERVNYRAFMDYMWVKESARRFSHTNTYAYIGRPSAFINLTHAYLPLPMPPAWIRFSPYNSFFDMTKTVSYQVRGCMHDASLFYYRGARVVV